MAGNKNKSSSKKQESKNVNSDKKKKETFEEHNQSNKSKLYFLLFGIIVLLIISLLVLLKDEGSQSLSNTKTTVHVFQQSPDLSIKKQKFLESYPNMYGYNGTLDEIRKTQTPQLNGLSIYIYLLT